MPIRRQWERARELTPELRASVLERSYISLASPTSSACAILEQLRRIARAPAVERRLMNAIWYLEDRADRLETVRAEQQQRVDDRRADDDYFRYGSRYPGQ